MWVGAMQDVEVVEPNSTTAQVYDEAYAQFRVLTERLRPLFARRIDA